MGREGKGGPAILPGVATTSPPLPPIPTVTTIDGVVEAIGSIIDWSISVSSRLGYFAAMYKRITIAICTAVSQGEFQDGPRMQRFDVAFATRYFDALNGVLPPYPVREAEQRSWRATFDAASRAEAIILQHLLAGGGGAYQIWISATPLERWPPGRKAWRRCTTTSTQLTWCYAARSEG